MVPAFNVCRELNLRSEKCIAYAFDRCVNQGPYYGKKLMRAAAKKHGSPVTALGEYEYFKELENAINTTLRGWVKDLAIERYLKVLHEDKLSITNFSVSSLTI